jgi:hypothetical protein
MEALDTKVPTSAAWLGGLGAAPFIGLAGATPFLAGAARSFAVHALVAYGATILSFLGAVHWGLAIGALAIGSQRGAKQDALAARLTLSVAPALVGWIALLVAPGIGLLILAAGVAAMLGVDVWATRSGQAPTWYPRLRIPLSCVVVLTLLFGAFM